MKNSNIPVAAAALHLGQPLAAASTRKVFSFKNHAETVQHQAAPIESIAWRKNAAQISRRNRTESTQKPYSFTQKLCSPDPLNLGENGRQ